MEDLEKLYGVVSQRGLYTKSFDEFKIKYSSDAAAQKKLFDVVSREGLYTKSENDFKNKYFKQVKPKGVTTEQNTASQSASVNGGSLSASGDVRPKTFTGERKGLVKKPKTFLQQAEEEQRTRPKVGETVVPKTKFDKKVEAEVKRQDKIDTQSATPIEKVKQGLAAPTVEKTKKEKVISQSEFELGLEKERASNYNYKYDDYAFEDINEQDLVKTTSIFKDVNKLNIDESDFARFLKNKTNFYNDSYDIKRGRYENQDIEYNANKLEYLRAQSTNDSYLQEYLNDRVKFLKTKLLTVKDDVSKQKIADEISSIGKDYGKYRAALFPDLTKEEERIRDRNFQLYNRAKSGKGNALYQTKETVENFFSGVGAPVMDLKQTITEKLDETLKSFDINVLDNAVKKGRFKTYYDKWNNSDGFDGVYGSGKEVKFGKDTYIVTDNGSVIDADTGSSINSFTDKNTLDSIKSLANNTEKKGSYFSGVSLTRQIANTAGQIIPQVLATKGLGGTTSLQFAKNAAIVNATMLGSSSFNETVSELTSNGIPEQEARKYASEVAAYMSVIGAVSGAISPNKASSKIAGQEFKDQIIKNTITAYKNSGLTGASGVIKKAINGLPNALKEIGLESISESGTELGETFGQKKVNSIINEKLGERILDDKMTKDEVVSIMLVSSLATLPTSAVGTSSELFGLDVKEQFNAASELNDEDLVKSVKNVVSTGQITAERGDELITQVRNYRNNKSKLPSDIKGKKAVDATQLIAERENLKQQRKNLDEVFHPEIDTKIESINNQLKGVLSQPETIEDTTGTGKSTQEFFGTVVKGGDERYTPSKSYEYEQEFTPEQDKFRKKYDDKKGNFDEHIATSIPTFRETQVKKGNAIIKMLEDVENPVVYDLGGSEGSWVKTITEESGGKIKTINLDPSPDMKEAFDKNKPENSEMSLEAFYSGWDDVPTHKPKEKADVVHESMMFQFIENKGDRKQYIDEVADKYLKEDGVFITEEKFKMNTDEEYAKNEKLKESHKNKYYTPEQQSLKSDEVLVGMKENQANFDQYVKELQDRFKYVKTYWKSGNFRGIIATNNESKLNSFLENLGETSNKKYNWEKPYDKNEVSEIKDARQFVNAQKEAMSKRKSDSKQVDILSEKDAQKILDEGGKLFMTNDGKSGAYVKADGYMGGLFKDPTAGRSEAAKVLQEVRIEHGGKFFDAFGTHLEDIYVKNGFKPVVRMDFNEEFAPEGWKNTNLKDKPDNVFFVYAPESDPKIGEGVRINDYKKAYEIAKNYEPNQTTTTTEEVTVPNQEGKNTGNDEVLPTSITKENFEGLNLSETLGLNTLSNVLEDWDNKLKDFSKDTLGVNLPVVVARGAIKAMKAAVSVSKTGADVLSAGINYVRNTDWYKNLNDSDKKDFESKGILSYLTEIENKKVAENVVKSETVDNKKSTKATIRQNTGQTDTSPKVTTTESKLLKEKFKNLQRGFKEGVKETNQFKKEFIEEVENSIKGLKGLLSSETSRILKAVRDINPNNIVDVQNKIDRLVEIIENKEFYRDIKNVKSDVSKLSKSKSKPQNLTNIAKKAGKVNERYLSKKEASEYKDTLDKIKNGLLPVSNPNYKPFNVEEVLNTLERLNDSANTNQILQLAEDYGFADLGLSEKEIIDLINGENIDEYVDNLEEAKKKQILDNFRNIAKYSQIGLKEKVFQTEISDREKKQVKNLREADLSNMSLQQLKDFTTVSDNITMNEDFSGAGKIDVVVSVKKAGNDIKGRNIPVNDITIDASSKWMLPSWANPAEWTSSFINHVTGINVFFVKMFGRKDGGFLYDKSKALDLSDANTIKTQKEKEFREAMSNKMDELSKKYPDIRDNKNNARRAVLAILLQAENGNVSDMTRLKEKYIKKSIDNITKSKNDAQSAKQIELMQNILTELENIKTKEELIDYLEKNDKGNFEVLKTARDFFAKNTQGLEEVANNYYNQKFDSRSYDDFYLPIMTKSTVPASLKKGDSDNVIGGNFGADVVNLVKTGSLESRKQYAGLRNDTIINLNFDDSAVGKYAEQVYTIEATPVVMYVKEFFSDPQIMSTIGIGNRIKLMELIGRKIDLDSGNRFGNLQAIDKNVMKIEKAVRQVGVTMGLGGITQAPKQFMTVMATAIRLGNKAYLLPKAMFSRGDAKEFLKIGSVSLRGDTIGATVRLGDNVNFKNMSLSEKSKISRLIENIARGASVTRQKAMEITMGALRFADTYAFESTYIAHYMERLIELGVPESEIDMKTEHLKLDDEVRREARAYALNMANVAQTSSDQSEHSKLATNQDAVGKIAMTIIMPFSGVPNNSMARMYGAMSRAASTKGASKEALNEVIATSLGEVLSFHAMKNFGIAYLTNALYQAFYGEEDDEDNFNWAFQTVKTISGGFTDLIPYPEYLEAEALNWLAYKTQKKEMQENGIKVDNYDSFKNYIKYLPFKEASDDSYSPVYLYKYEEANNYDTGILSKAKDLGIYSIPIDQYQTASEVYEALFKGTVTRESRYSKVEYEIAPEHKNFIMTMALVETMTMIAATDADTRRFMEKRFREIVRESDKEYIKTPKNSSNSKPKKISDSTWGQY